MLIETIKINLFFLELKSSIKKIICILKQNLVAKIENFNT